MIVTRICSSQSQGQKLVLLEAGCGVGNCIFPLLEEDLSIFIYACDFSPRAVEFVKVKVTKLCFFFSHFKTHIWSTFFSLIYKLIVYMHSAFVYDYSL